MTGVQTCALPISVYFPLAWMFGGIDKEELKLLRRRKKKLMVEGVPNDPA